MRLATCGQGNSPSRSNRVTTAKGVERSEAEHYLGIIEGRCLGGTNGAEWFVRQMAEREDMDRYDALRAVLADYREGMAANVPVHLW